MFGLCWFGFWFGLVLLGVCGWITVVVAVSFEWCFVLVYVSGLCGFHCLVGVWYYALVLAGCFGFCSLMRYDFCFGCG